MSRRDRPHCIVCRGVEQRFAFRRRGEDYYRCGVCGLISTHPAPDEQTLAAFYAEQAREGNYQLLLEFAEEYSAKYAHDARLLRRAMRRVGQRLSGARVLDVGCFIGGFVEQLLVAGADARGMEQMPEAVAVANERLGGRVTLGDALRDDVPGGPFDAVSMLGVLEHLLDPLAVLRRCRDLLADGGVLMIQTPCCDTMPARLMGKYWPPYLPVEHIHLFSRTALRQALRRLGLRVLSLQAQWKRLPVAYVYHMLRLYGPEIHRIITPLYRVSPGFLRRAHLPFYVGGVTVMAARADR